jgi:hypothetical protein
MPIRASTVEKDPSFGSDLDQLRGKYPEVDGAVQDLIEILVLGYDLPEMPTGIAQVYARIVDYPARGADGLQQFLITYHATDPQPSWTNPYRTFTLLTITDRKP